MTKKGTELLITSEQEKEVKVKTSDLEGQEKSIVAENPEKNTKGR